MRTSIPIALILCMAVACRPDPPPDLPDFVPVRVFDPDRLYESKLANLDGITLHYLDWGGSGEVLLFLAGGDHTAYLMSGLAARFRESHRVLALTRRGPASQTIRMTATRSTITL